MWGPCCPRSLSVAGHPLRKHVKTAFTIFIYTNIYNVYTLGHSYSQEEKKKKIHRGQKLYWTDAFVDSTSCQDALGRVSSSRVIRQSFSTVCRVISKLHASDSFRCEYLPDWPFKRYTHPTLYSFWGERRNKWFNTHTHTHTFRTVYKWLHSAMAVFFC